MLNFLTEVPAEETTTIIQQINDYMLNKPFQTALIALGILAVGFLVYRNFKKPGRRR